MLINDGQAEAAVSFGELDALPEHIASVLSKARVCWLRNVELVDLLKQYRQLGFEVSTQAPYRPASMR